MPQLPLPPCHHPACAELQTEERNGYCARHQDDAMRRSSRGRYRRSAWARGYTSHYQHARRWVLAGQPLCIRCEQEGRVTAAQETHHKVPLSQGGTNDPENLMPLCKYHHMEEHKRLRENELSGALG